MKTKQKIKRDWRTGRKPHPQKHLTCRALNMHGDVVTMPYMKKIIIELPAPFVDHIKRKAAEKGYNTMAAMLRKIILTHPDVHILEVDKISQQIWGMAKPAVKGIPTPQPARRQLIQ
jgi:hypothetical protein